MELKYQAQKNVNIYVNIVEKQKCKNFVEEYME